MFNRAWVTRYSMFLWILGFTSFMVPVIISALIWLRYRLTTFPDPNNVENRANLSAREVQLPLKYCCLNILLNNTFSISKMKLKKLVLSRLLVTSRLTSGPFYSPVASMHLAVVAASVCSLYFLEPWQSLDRCHYSVPPPDAQRPCRWTESWAGLDAGLTLRDRGIGRKVSTAILIYRQSLDHWELGHIGLFFPPVKFKDKMPPVSFRLLSQFAISIVHFSHCKSNSHCIFLFH